MIRRILVGAAIAAAALGFSATGASADPHNSANTGQAILSGFHTLGDLLHGAADDALRDAVRHIDTDITEVAKVQEMDVDVLSNTWPSLGGSNNLGSDALAQGTRY
jgi:phage-related tail protein